MFWTNVTLFCLFRIWLFVTWFYKMILIIILLKTDTLEVIVFLHKIGTSYNLFIEFIQMQIFTLCVLMHNTYLCFVTVFSLYLIWNDFVSRIDKYLISSGWVVFDLVAREHKKSILAFDFYQISSCPFLSPHNLNDAILSFFVSWIYFLLFDARFLFRVIFSPISSIRFYFTKEVSANDINKGSGGPNQNLKWKVKESRKEY